MALTGEQIAQGAAWLAKEEPAFAKQISEIGLPQPRIRPKGYQTLLHTIVGQQVSTKAADSIWKKLSAQVGKLDDPKHIAQVDPDALRTAGLSRMKVSYAQSLAEHVVSGALPLENLPTDNEAAIALLTSVRGLGRWSAEIYLLFAEGRPDIFPAGDLAVQVQAGRLFMDDTRPSEKDLRLRAQNWSPWRGVSALMLWHGYNAPPL